MNKQQRNQINRRRNHQNLKAYEFETSNQIKAVTHQENNLGKYSDSYLAELEYRIKRYKAISREERRGEEEARMKVNTVLEAELRDRFPDSHVCCLW